MKLSVVVIGQNVAPFLPKCLAAIRLIDTPYELLYVDSASRDQSCTIAASFGATVLSLTEKSPNAAKARNLGWRTAKGEFILFLDGDTEVQPEFVVNKLPLFADSQVAIICGQRQEKFPDANFYHRALNVEWALPKEPFPQCGGDALMRRSVLESLGGFDESLWGGEEPELCFRLHKRGLTVLSLPETITTHDLQMTHFSDYWRRCFRTGYAYREVANKTGVLWKNEARHNILKGPLLILLLPLLPFLILRTAWNHKHLGLKTALSYGIHAHFQHIPMFFGQLRALTR